MAGSPNHVVFINHPPVQRGQLSKFSAFAGANMDCVLPPPGKENRPPVGPQQCVRTPSPLSDKRVRVPPQPRTPSPGHLSTWPQTAILFNPREGGLYFGDVREGIQHSLHSGSEYAFPSAQLGRAELRIVVRHSYDWQLHVRRANHRV